MSNDNVEQITTYIACCPHCDCRSFELLSNGTIACANCQFDVQGSYQEVAAWRRCLPEVPKGDPRDVPDDSNTVKVTALGHVEFARRSVMKHIEKWNKDGDLAAIFAYHRDGSGKHWSAAETEDQRDWVVRKMLEIIEHLKATKFNDG